LHFMTLSDIVKLTTSKCAVAIWNFKTGFEYWDVHAHDVIALFKGMRIERESPHFFQNIEYNLKKHEHWVRYEKHITLFHRECKSLPVKLHPGLHKSSVAVFEELRETVAKLEEAYPFPLEFEFKALEYPQNVKEIVWLMENVMVNACDGDIDRLQDLSVNIGSTIIQLGSLTAAKYLRRDQARKVLELMLEPTRIGVELHDVLHTPELDFLNEAAMDDAMTTLIDQIIAANGKAVTEYKSGKEKALGTVIGQVMKQVKADPRVVKEAVLERIKLVP
jgi:GatB domain